jgi:hypothetical protein
MIRTQRVTAEQFSEFLKEWRENCKNRQLGQPLARLGQDFMNKFAKHTSDPYLYNEPNSVVAENYIWTHYISATPIVSMRQNAKKES